jgi:ubiquinone/menaquinone biosynthesis C-methylase UbiE
MTWEETIQMIRGKEEFQDLVRLAYFDEDLSLNVERFSQSEEFSETLAIFNTYAPQAKTILDIGSGNGVSAVNFALKGYQVAAVEPDDSLTVGAGAINWVKEQQQLDNLTVYNSFAEDINFEDNSFDIVYVRQAMHHANELFKFMEECVRVLKPNGLLLTVRDHVIFDAKDKEWFLETHALHKYYGGENAFMPSEYKQAITEGGAEVVKELKYYDSSINYYPLTEEQLEKTKREYIVHFKKHLQKKIGFLSKLPGVFSLYAYVKGIDANDGLNEKKIPGRMYTYISIKK